MSDEKAEQAARDESDVSDRADMPSPQQRHIFVDEPQPLIRRPERRSTDSRVAGPIKEALSRIVSLKPSNGSSMGVLGGKQSGKSYLLHAMIYRTWQVSNAGVLAPYLAGEQVEARRADAGHPEPRLLHMINFMKRYENWARLSDTKREMEEWYRLRLYFRTGWLGGDRAFMDIDFLDPSGEYRAATDLTPEVEREWHDCYHDARTMAFCLPLWVAFPRRDLPEQDLKERSQALEGFESVLRNFKKMRQDLAVKAPLKSILVLTMADDWRGGLNNLFDNWIRPYMQAPKLYLEQLRKESGVASYLANARQVSNMLLRMLKDQADPKVGVIPEKLNFGGGKPWVIAVSAVEGKLLEQIDQRKVEPPQTPPVPVHVELPLFLALAEEHKILM